MSAVEAVLHDIDPALTRLARRLVGDEWEDAAQEARIVILRAIDSFDAASGVPLGAWVWLRAKGAVIDYFRSTASNRRRELVPLEAIAEPKVICGEYDAVEARAVLRQVASMCSAAEQDTLALAMEGLNTSEIASRRGVSASRVSKTMRAVRERVDPATPAPSTNCSLTDEQLSTVQALADGLTLQEIADQEAIAPESVKGRLRAIANKLGLPTAGQLPVVVACMRAGHIS